jgi:hypothetical protein
MKCGDCNFLNNCPAAHSGAALLPDDVACAIGIEVEQLREEIKHLRKKAAQADTFLERSVSEISLARKLLKR